jgi:hypothetical protein
MRIAAAKNALRQRAVARALEKGPGLPLAQRIERQARVTVFKRTVRFLVHRVPNVSPRTAPVVCVFPGIEAYGPEGYNLLVQCQS